MSPWGSKAKGSQRAYSVRKRRNLLHVARGSDHHRELAASLQHHQAACIARLQATSPRGVRACIRRVAGCATSTGFAGHASTEAGLELTFHLDHPMGSHQAKSDSTSQEASIALKGGSGLLLFRSRTKALDPYGTPRLPLLPACLELRFSH